MLNRNSEKGKKKKEDKSTRKCSKAARDMIVSGDDIFDTLKILQALKPAQDRVDMYIAGLERLLMKFEDDKGTFSKEKTEKGYDAVFRFGETEYRNHYLKDDMPDGFELISASSDNVDVDDFARIWEVRMALKVLPERYYAKKKLEELVAYIENDNALKGLCNIKEILGKNEGVLYEMIMAKEEDSMPDFSKTAEVLS
ncbi:MAG: hypothetical protein M0P07_07595 [Candidatus Methanomethylophilaceae archaeon]|nr:hypothetical protein [Candidatus Methanomethylophilaceae archaeon]